LSAIWGGVLPRYDIACRYLAVFKFKNGYDKKSRIILDRNLGLIDGSHRMAMALHYGFDNISASIINIDYSVEYSVDWFIKHGLSSSEINEIVSKGKELYNDARKPFSCIIWSPAVAFTNVINDCRGRI